MIQLINQLMRLAVLMFKLNFIFPGVALLFLKLSALICAFINLSNPSIGITFVWEICVLIKLFVVFSNYYFHLIGVCLQILLLLLNWQTGRRWIPGLFLLAM